MWPVFVKGDLTKTHPKNKALKKKEHQQDVTFLHNHRTETRPVPKVLGLTYYY